MTAGPAQLTLAFEHRPALEAEDFIVSPANAAAVALIDRWPDWPLHAAVVVGPPHSGKSHLANVWRLRAAGIRIAASELAEARIGDLARLGATVVEDLDQGIASERALFHMLNLAREQAGSLLLTSAVPPGELQVALPDLRSRLRALAIAAIEPPDEALIRALLVKLFADRQLAVEPHVIDYLARHVERSTGAVGAVVAEIDRRGLVARRPVTRALAAEAVAALASRDD